MGSGLKRLECEGEGPEGGEILTAPECISRCPGPRGRWPGRLLLHATRLYQGPEQEEFRAAASAKSVKIAQAWGPAVS